MKKGFSLVLLFAAILVVELNAQSSLWVLNPQNTWNWRQGTIEEATLSIKPAGNYMEMGLYLTFSARESGFSGSQLLETVLNFRLPQGSMILDSWLWVGEDIVQGKIIDKWTASNIYEGIVNRRRDPSILKKVQNDQYELRVYPMKAGEQRKVKITYLVPGSWTQDRLSVPLPYDILQSSRHVPTLHTLVWPEEGWSEPNIPEWSDKNFILNYDNQFGQYYRLDIPASEFSKALNFNLTAPMNNGFYLEAVTEESGESVYQLAINFEQFLEAEQGRKVAIMVDYEPQNSSAARSYIFNGLQRYLLQSFTEKDSFNLFYSRFETEQVSPTWLPISEQNLDQAFEALKSDFITLYSNLPGLVSKATSFVKNNPGGQMLLFSNADNFGSQNKANSLLKDIQAMNGTAIPISIADFQDKNFSQQRIGDRYYFGQEYFFINLSRISGGAYARLEQYQSYESLYQTIFGTLQGSITSFDLYSSTANGFCFGRYDLNRDEKYYLGDSFMQTGKFIGTAPFVLYLTGMFKAEPFYELIQVEPHQVTQGDSLTKKIWYGNHINEMEQLTADNEIVSRVLSESINHRILSQYTAFLCLEPSDTVAVCASCEDESRLTGVLEFELASQNLKLFPNPCSEYLDISFVAPEDWNGSNAFLRVYSVTGQLVHEMAVAIAPEQEFSERWNLTNPSGKKLEAGSYWIVLSDNNYRFNQQLQIH